MHNSRQEPMEIKGLGNFPKLNLNYVYHFEKMSSKLGGSKLGGIEVVSGVRWMGVGGWGVRKFTGIFPENPRPEIPENFPRPGVVGDYRRPETST